MSSSKLDTSSKHSPGEFLKTPINKDVKTINKKNKMKNGDDDSSNEKTKQDSGTLFNSII